MSDSDGDDAYRRLPAEGVGYKPPSRRLSARRGLSKAQLLLGAEQCDEHTRVHRKRRSVAARLLNQPVYKTTLLAIIILSVVIFMLASVPDLRDKHALAFEICDIAVATFFLVDFILRFAAGADRKRYRHLAPWHRRLRWLCSWDGALCALATFPFYLDLLDGETTWMSFAWLRVFRVFVLFRTSGYAQAVNTAARVLYVNRAILVVSCSLVLFVLLTTSTLLFLVSDDEVKAINDFHSIPCGSRSRSRKGLWTRLCAASCCSMGPLGSARALPWCSMRLTQRSLHRATPPQ